MRYLSFVAFICVGLILSCTTSKGGSRMSDIREPVVAGRFYPANKDSLLGMLERMFHTAPKKEFKGKIYSIIAPHAGYEFSGYTSACVYSALSGRNYSTVIVIGPSHYTYFEGASVLLADGYKTPLGVVPIDLELANALREKSPIVDFHPEAHIREHSVEVQVPFLQFALGDGWKLVPIVMGTQDRSTVDALADAIVQLVKGKKVLLVASSDLYHGYSYRDCVESDSVVIDYIEACEFDELLRYNEEVHREGKAAACGAGPIAAVLEASLRLGGDSVVLVHRINSNDVMGTRGGYVVGYASFVVVGNEASDEQLGGDTKEMLSLIHI